MRPTGRFSTARLIEVGTSRGKFVPGVPDIVPYTPRIEAEFGPAGRAVVAWTKADVDHPIVRAARTNGSVLDAAQTVAAGALEALALGPRGEAILLGATKPAGAAREPPRPADFGPPSSCGHAATSRRCACAPRPWTSGHARARRRAAGRLVSLEELVLASTPVADISPLAGLSSLRLLQLQHAVRGEISSLAP